MGKKKTKKVNKYYLNAYTFAVNKISKTFKPFTCEFVKDLFHEINDEPRDNRIWGNVFRRLSKEGKIIFKCYEKCKSKKGHGHPSAVWISIEYSRTQSQNRKANSKTQITLFDG